MTIHATSLTELRILRDIFNDDHNDVFDDNLIYVFEKQMVIMMLLSINDKSSLFFQGRGYQFFRPSVIHQGRQS